MNTGERAGPAALVDLSHTVEHGMITYQGLPGPSISDFLGREASRASYAPGTEFQIGRIDMVANTGTYVDAPFHRYADGRDVAALPLESLAHLEALVVRIDGRTAGGQAFGVAALDGLDVRGKAILFHTGWDRHWRTGAYSTGHPFLTRDAAACLAAGGAALAGIDSYNIDDTADGSRPAHSILLAGGIPICEHLCNLGGVPDRGARFYAVPVKVAGFGSFPVRAFAVI